MQPEKINCEQAKKIDIIDYLESKNIYPVKFNGNDFWYLSPIRSENTASFKVNRRLNVWYDHGIGKGGNLIDLAILLHHCSVEAFLNMLNSGGNTVSFHQPVLSSQLSPQAVEKKLKMIAVKPLNNQVLCGYLASRRIPEKLAKKYCHEIIYVNRGKEFFAIGFKNNSEGFELRTADFKGTLAPKSFSFLDNKTEQAVAVFEGFIDFLSLLAMKKDILPEPTNFLILNSLSFFDRALPIMQEHEKVYLLLDNDNAGKNCASQALKISSKFEDLSNHYQQYKDINEWLMQEGNIELKQIQPKSFRHRL
jgi:hypothetical protein